MAQTRFPYLINSCMVIVSLLIVIACVEGVSTILYKQKPEQVREYPNGYHQRNNLLGYVPPALTENKSSLQINGKPVYDVVYSIDEYQRRRTPISGDGAHHQFALFFGCSFTYGEGVNGNETLPYFFAGNSREFVPYNYGFHGYGPQQMLARLEDSEFHRQIKEPQGIAIYLYLADAHEQRVMGSMYVVNRWGKDMPYYRLDDHDNLVRKGSFTTGRPWLSRVYALLDHSYFLKYFKIDFPPYISDDDYQLTVRIIAKSRDEFNQQFKNSKFYVVIYPTNKPVRIIPYLQKMGIDYFDYSKLFDPAEHKLADGHPNAEAYKLLAKKLAEDMAKQAH